MNKLNSPVMNSFIEDYLSDPASAVASAVKRSNDLSWANEIDDSIVYDALSSGQFRLYETIVSTPLN